MAGLDNISDGPTDFTWPLRLKAILAKVALGGVSSVNVGLQASPLTI